MSVTPRGMSVQEAYRLYRDGHLLVNRRYQRKLVWTIEEKQRLIDSILRGYPIPLILLAQRPEHQGSGSFEIIDGIQRLNAIFGFIENGFPLEDQLFDIDQFTRARQAAEGGAFPIAVEDRARLPPNKCADLLDYQLAVTIDPASDENRVTDVFGRINSSGKQLSAQEKRQAGVVTPFSDLVRQIAAELRGDASKEILLLFEMPEISIESRRQPHGYGLRAEDIFWCKQGILRNTELRESEDEQVVADLATSILLESPFAASREEFDRLYDRDSTLFPQIEQRLAAYGPSRLAAEIKAAFSYLRETVEAVSDEPYCFRNVVAPRTTNPVKAAFYAVYMAFFELIFQENRVPDDAEAIMDAIRGIQRRLTVAAHYTRPEDRLSNVRMVKGLVQDHFVRPEAPVLRHGPGLSLDFENALRRSRIETPRYEFKQGLLRLYGAREKDREIDRRLLETICGIANIGPDGDGYILVGVADNEDTASKIVELDGGEAIEVIGKFIVGVEREANVLGISLDQYVQQFVQAISQADLSQQLRADVLSNVDAVEYRGKTVIRVRVPAQREVSFFENRCFIREGSSTREVQGAEIVAISKRFGS